MEVFVLMGEIMFEGDALLGVYASLEEAVNAQGVYLRDREADPFDHYFVLRQVVGATADTDVDRIDI